MSFLPFLIIIFFLESIETCPEGCGSCIEGNGEYSCKSCNYGFYKIKDPNVDYYKCGKYQAEHCTTCSPSTINKCSSCQSGYYSEGEICKECDSNCGGCEYISTNCTSCSYGYYLSNAKCYKCDSNCATRKNTERYCTSCSSGEYVSSNAQCLPCNSNCKTCVTTATHCTSCIDGEYVSLDYRCLKTCKTTATNCLTCNSGE